MFIKLSTGAVGFGMVMSSIFMNETPGPKPSYPRDGSKNAALWKTVFWMGIALMLLSMHIGVNLGPDDTGLSNFGPDDTGLSNFGPDDTGSSIPEQLQTVGTDDYFENV